MIVASHQPNFMPYMGFFYKMYMCDVFTLSNDVQFSKRGYHNYNHFAEGGELVKITVPVSVESGAAIKTAKLSDWQYHREKLRKRLRSAYAKSFYFEEYFPQFDSILARDYERLEELNVDLILEFARIFDMRCEIVPESSMHLNGNASCQIVQICKETGCDVYLSGTGAEAYLDTDMLRQNGIKLLWSGYEPIAGYMSNGSAFDYVMRHGSSLPTRWAIQRRLIRNA